MKTFRLVVTAITHSGLVRANNQDTIGVGQWIQSEAMATPQLLTPASPDAICQIADGMGGHNAGEVASFLVATRLAQEARFLKSEQDFEHILHRINDEMYEQMTRAARLSSMGTTIAGLSLRDEKVILFNIGDSRIYHELEGYLRQVSVDDVPPMDRASSGNRALGYAEKRNSSLITQALGGSAVRLVNEPHVLSMKAVEGDRYLLCSDGLTDMVTLNEMEKCLSSDDLNTVCRLLDAALISGGHDNVSVMIVRLKGEDEVRTTRSGITHE